MVANILIASGFFALGFLLGGAFALRSSWKIMQKQAKELREKQLDPLIIRVYDFKE